MPVAPIRPGSGPPGPKVGTRPHLSTATVAGTTTPPASNDKEEVLLAEAKKEDGVLKNISTILASKDKITRSTVPNAPPAHVAHRGSIPPTLPSKNTHSPFAVSAGVHGTTN